MKTQQRTRWLLWRATVACHIAICSYLYRLFDHHSELNAIVFWELCTVKMIHQNRIKCFTATSYFCTFREDCLIACFKVDREERTLSHHAKSLWQFKVRTNGSGSLWMNEWNDVFTERCSRNLIISYLLIDMTCLKNHCGKAEKIERLYWWYTLALPYLTSYFDFSVPSTQNWFSYFLWGRRGKQHWIF